MQEVQSAKTRPSFGFGVNVFVLALLPAPLPAVLFSRSGWCGFSFSFFWGVVMSLVLIPADILESMLDSVITNETGFVMDCDVPDEVIPALDYICGIVGRRRVIRLVPCPFRAGFCAVLRGLILAVLRPARRSFRLVLVSHSLGICYYCPKGVGFQF